MSSPRSFPPSLEPLLPAWCELYREGLRVAEIMERLDISVWSHQCLLVAARDRGLIVPRGKGSLINRSPAACPGGGAGAEEPFRVDLAWLSGYRIAWEHAARCAACGRAVALRARVQWQRRRGKAARLVHVACAGVDAERSAS